MVGPIVLNDEEAAMLNSAMKALVDHMRLGFVASVCPDGTPNLSPKGTTAVWDDDHLVFADIHSPQTVENLRHNPVTEINVVDPFTRKGYRFKGMATIVEDGDELEAIVAFYRARRVTSPIRCAVKVRVERAQELISPAYDDPWADERLIRASYLAYYTGIPAEEFRPS